MLRKLWPLLVVAVALGLWFFTGGKDAGSSLRRKFGAALDEKMHVTHFEFSGAGMDHSYIWVIEPADTAFVETLVKSAQLTRATPTNDPSSLHSTWPEWWHQQTIEALPEHYFREDGKEYWHVWVDSDNDLIYLQWFDT